MQWEPGAAGPGGGKLEEAERQFARWRKRCRGYGRIPEELWRLAALAAASHGAEPTAARLGLNVERLREWLRGLGAADGAAAPAELARPAEFVEWPSLVGGASECTLELEEPSGRKLRISLQGPATKHALELGRLLWQGRP